MDCEIKDIVASLMASYCDVGGINHIDCSNLPSKRAIELACQDLLQLAFPGFLDSEAVRSEELELLTTERVAKVVSQLKHEVARSLKLRAQDAQDHSEEAERVVCAFLRELPTVRRLLRTDVEAAYEGDPAARSFEEIILSYPCIEAIAIQRMAHVLYREDLPLIPRMMTEWAHEKTGIDIHPGAQIGSHFFIDHGTGVVVGETCIIGDHVKLYHGVTLGARSFQKDEEGNLVKGTEHKRHPSVEDGAIIYPNATILGGATVIGARSTVGANVFLMESIPPDSLLAIEGFDQSKLLNKAAFRNDQESKAQAASR
ncbi:MAG: serine O-acetyltransferase [Verrucomicrobiales bacterium]|jgi:serine O-acetyltransferase